MGIPDDLAPEALRSAFGRFATGVTIVTCQDAQGASVGLTVNSFASLSLEPPLVLWSLRRVSPRMDAFVGATHFAVNVLASHQIDLSRRFASAREDKFDAGQWSIGLGSAPVLDGCLAVFECVHYARHDASDHVMFVGRVLCLRETAQAPLVYHHGHYRSLDEPA